MDAEAGGIPGVDVTPPEQLAALEALLFASDAPLPLERIAEVLEVSEAAARAAVAALRARCEVPERGLAVVEIGGGVRLVTRPEHAPVLLRLQRLRLKSRLSRAAVETLAIIAYRQPISRPEIEQLRGVGAESVLAHLLERRLIRVVGRKATPGRPVLYGTTREFLEHFGLNELDDLPPFDGPGESAGAAATGENGAGEMTAEASGPGSPGAAGTEATPEGADAAAPTGPGDPDRPAAQEASTG
ncbi:MAG TPA: SMC-Scp complex subunit ScpB [Methylomirabilota bacterium]|nr:SMC-Scp complex subunit ScpB [Methylomirabilota bacterium]